MYTYTYMNITTYIRKEDEHLWRLIVNKSQWMHEQLNRLAPDPGMQRNARMATPAERVAGLGESVELPSTPITRPPIPDIPGLTTANKIKSNGTCKVHGLPLDSRGRCMQKGCKYA